MATPNQLPAKSPILDKYRSRLQLTYRTNISGTPVPQKLPFRVLVLGEFLGADQRAMGLELRDRKVRSIQMGETDGSVGAFMKELTPWMRVPESVRAELEAPVPGNLTVQSLSFAAPATTAFDPTTKEATVTVSGFATFTSLAVPPAKPATLPIPVNGACNITTSKIPVTGTLTVVGGGPLPTVKAGSKLDLVVTGTVSGQLPGPSPDKPGTVFTAVLAAGQKAQVDVPIDGAKVSVVAIPGSTDSFGVTVDATTAVTVTALRTIPFPSLHAFSPDEVAASIPELHRLSVIRGLALELQSNLRNNRQFAKAMTSALAALQDPKILDAFQAWAKTNFPQLSVMSKDKSPANG